MSDLCYCQYAFAQPDCRVQEIGPGVDPQFPVELIREGQIAAVTSRVGLDQFAPERLQGKTAEDFRWLGKIAARHNEIICQAARSSAVLPLRLGTVFRSRDSLQNILRHCRSTVAKFLERLGDRHEWGVKLYLESRRPEPKPQHTVPPPPHFLAGAGGKPPAANQRRTEAVSCPFPQPRARPTWPTKGPAGTVAESWRVCCRRSKGWKSVWRTRPNTIAAFAICRPT